MLCPAAPRPFIANPSRGATLTSSIQTSKPALRAFSASVLAFFALNAPIRAR